MDYALYKKKPFILFIAIDLLVKLNVYTAEKYTLMNKMLYYYFLLIVEYR